MLLHVISGLASSFPAGVRQGSIIALKQCWEWGWLAFGDAGSCRVGGEKWNKKKYPSPKPNRLVPAQRRCHPSTLLFSHGHTLLECVHLCFAVHHWLCGCLSISQHEGQTWASWDQSFSRTHWQCKPLIKSVVHGKTPVKDLLKAWHYVINESVGSAKLGRCRA